MNTKIVTSLEMRLLNEIKFYTEKKFSSASHMWIHLDCIPGDMKINRGLISSLVRKNILIIELYDNILKVNKSFYCIDKNNTAYFVNISK